MLKKTSVWDKLLIGLLFFHLFWNLFWIGLNNAPFPWDQSAHSTIVLHIANAIKNGQILNIFSISNYYPIFVHTLASIPIIFFGPLPKLTQITATFIFLLTLYLIYRYIFLLSENKKVSFISVALFSFFPIVFNFSRWLMLDIPTVGILFLALYFLEKSENWTRRSHTIYFFIASGILMMTKWTGMLFLIIPVAFTMFLLFKKNEFGKVWKNIVVGILFFLAIILPWYLVNFRSLFSQSKINIIGEEGADPANVFSLQSFGIYFSQFFNSQANLWTATSFFICLPFFIFQKNKRKWFILSMIFGSYLIFTFISNKDSRYTMAYLPFVTLVITSVLEKLNLKFRYLANCVTFCLIIMSMIYYLVLTIRPLGLEGKYLFVDWHQFGRTDFININDRLVKKYDKNNWSVNTFLDDVNKITKGQNAKVEVAIEDEHFNPSTLQFYLYTRQYKGLMENIRLGTPDIYFLNLNFQNNVFPSTEAIAEYLKNTDYIVMSPDDVGTEYLRNKDALIQLREFVLYNTRVSCNSFQSIPAPSRTTCYAKDDEILQTSSDVQIDGQIKVGGQKEIKGPTKIYCEWGCTFKVIRNSDVNIHPYPQIEKTYVLPDGKTVHLYSLK